MNELQTLRNLRESTSSSDESLAALRHDLLRETRARRGFRIPRPAWRLAVAGALAVSLLGAATIVQRGSEPASPVAFLEQAAAAVESRASGQLEPSRERPRNDQWIYQKTLWDSTPASFVGMSRFFFPEDVPGEREEWIRFDGKGWWEVEDGDPTEVPMKPDLAMQGNPAEIWDSWQTLPRDPRALLDATYKQVDAQRYFLAPDLWAPHPDVLGDPRKRNQAAMSAISQVLAMGRGLTEPKDFQATLYRALALIPDIEVIEGVKDVAGRDAIAVAVAVTSTTKVIILLDPVTYDYLGWGSELKDGKVTNGVALLDAKVVNEPGER